MSCLLLDTSRILFFRIRKYFHCISCKTKSNQKQVFISKNDIETTILKFICRKNNIHGKLKCLNNTRK